MKTRQFEKKKEPKIPFYPIFKKLQDNSKRPFFSLFLMRKLLSISRKWFQRPYFPLIGVIFLLKSGLRRGLQDPCVRSSFSSLREGFTKKSSCSLGFCPNEGGGGPCPNFLSTFHKLYILGQFGDGEEGGDPCPNFLHISVKKRGTSCPD